jgi:hypothetical protein
MVPHTIRATPPVSSQTASQTFTHGPFARNRFERRKSFTSLQTGNRKVHPLSIDFCSRLFLITKKTGEISSVLNLKLSTNPSGSGISNWRPCQQFVPTLIKATI